MFYYGYVFDTFLSINTTQGQCLCVISLLEQVGLSNLYSVASWISLGQSDVHINACSWGEPLI